MNSVGLLAIYSDEAAFIQGVKAVRARGFTKFEAFSPYAIEEIFENVPPSLSRINRLGAAGLAGGLFGVFGGLFMQWYANSISYPLNVGGKPLFSWPNFVPICFALMILCSVLSIVVTLFFSIGLPQPYHSAFNVAAMNLSEDRFYVYFPQEEPLFSEARAFAIANGAAETEEVAP